MRIKLSFPLTNWLCRNALKENAFRIYTILYHFSVFSCLYQKNESCLRKTYGGHMLGIQSIEVGWDIVENGFISNLNDVT